MHALVFGLGTPFAGFAFGIGNTHADYIYNPHPFHTSQKFYTLQKKDILVCLKLKKQKRVLL